MIPELSRTERRIFSAIVGHPHSSLSDVAELLGLNRSEVTRRVYRLERLGLVETLCIHLKGEGQKCPPVNLRTCTPAPWVLA